MAKKEEIEVQGTVIRLYSQEEKDFICITDIAKKFETGVAAIESWMRNRNTIEFLGTWEMLKNPSFNSDGFDGIKQNVGLNTFKISVKKWVEHTNAVGLQSKAGRYGGTYAHKDIAMQFCYWLSPTFQLYVIQEFDRLKSEEAKRLENDWNVRRELAKITYPLQQTAIQERLIPSKIKSNVVGAFYASEADLVNMAVFGMTAKDWRSQNPEKKGNLRDFATHEQLVIVNTLQSHNAHLIRNNVSQQERLEIMNDIAIFEMRVLLKASAAMNRLKNG